MVTLPESSRDDNSLDKTDQKERSWSEPLHIMLRRVLPQHQRIAAAHLRQAVKLLKTRSSISEGYVDGRNAERDCSDY